MRDIGIVKVLVVAFGVVISLIGLFNNPPFGILILASLIAYGFYELGKYRGEKKSRELHEIGRRIEELNRSYRSLQKRIVNYVIPFIDSEIKDDRYGCTVEEKVLSMAKEYLLGPYGGRGYDEVDFESDYVSEFPEWLRPRGSKVPVVTVYNKDADLTWVQSVRSELQKVVWEVDYAAKEIQLEEDNSDDENAKHPESLSDEELWQWLFERLIVSGVLSWEYAEKEEPLPSHMLPSHIKKAMKKRGVSTTQVSYEDAYGMGLPLHGENKKFVFSEDPQKLKVYPLCFERRL